MSKKATDAAMNQLHALLAEALTGIIKEGVKVIDRQGNVEVVTAPAAFFKEAREFLKDNGVEALPEANKNLQNLAAVLPFPSQGDDAEFATG